MVKRFALAGALALAGAAILATGSSAGSPAFSNTPLIVPFTPPPGSGIVAATTGDSEPSISIGQSGPLKGRMAVGGLAWIPFAVNMWTGAAGSVPTYFGAMDTRIPETGNRLGLGDGDEDIDIASTGTTHLADLDFIFNPAFNHAQLGVSVTNCPQGATSKDGCEIHILDTTSADRQWITSNGKNVWVSYHDSGNSTLIRTKISRDDGNTWASGGSPVVGQGDITGNSTFNNIQGPIVADPQNANRVFDVFASGDEQSKAFSANFNRMNVSRSTDGGKSYTAQTIFSAPLFIPLDNIFPSLAVDPVTDYVYVVWTDQHGVWLSISKNHGDSYSPAKKVSSVLTTVEPWVAAYNGKVDVVYYGTFATSKNSPAAVWNVYDAQSSDNGGSFNEVQVSQKPNHFGGICTFGTGCSNPLVSRTLLDLFEVSENPLTGKASLVYTDDTINKWTLNGTVYPLPEIVLAQEG